MANREVPQTRTVVVTGGSTGIGWGICEDLLQRGYSVVSVARRKPPRQAKGLFSYEADLSEPSATADTAARIAEEHEVTGLVNNAGIIQPALIEGSGFGTHVGNRPKAWERPWDTPVDKSRGAAV